MIQLRTVNITKKYYGCGESTVTALRDCNICIKKGENIAITGPSGSGKSTLLHLLGGLDQPTSGKVFIKEKDIYALPDDELTILRRREIGFIFQDYNLLPIFTAEENIAFPLMLDNRKAEKEYLHEILNYVGIYERRKHLPSELSGGQQQRVAIARALVNEPEIILADEPTGNLDRNTGFEIINLLKNLSHKYKQTLIVITHNEDIAAVFDRIINITDGVVSEINQVNR